MSASHEERLPPVFPFDWASEWGEGRCGPWVAFHLGEVCPVLRWIPPGAFWMGSPGNKPERLDNEIRHRVIPTRGLWLAETACTQTLWSAIMDADPSRFKGSNRPVERVSWGDVQAFLNRLNEILEQDAGPGSGFRLPTEAEWEYACRAGTETPFSFGETISTDQVNYDGRYPYSR